MKHRRIDKEPMNREIAGAEDVHPASWTRCKGLRRKSSVRRRQEAQRQLRRGLKDCNED